MRHRSMRVVPLLVILVVAVAAAGCARVAKPNGWATPTVAGSSLYASLSGGKITSLDQSNYQEQWEFPSSDTFQCKSESKASKRTLSGIYETPAIDDSTIYLAGYNDGAVYAVNRSDGTCKWRFETGDVIVGGTVLGSAGLYVPSTDGYLYLLNPADGTVVNKFNTGDSWSTPLVTSDSVYVDTMDGKLWKLSLDLKDQVWSKPFSVSAALLTPPTLMGDKQTLLVGGIGKKLYAVNTQDGTQTWAVDGGNWFWGPPAIDGTTVYATTLAGEVKSIDGTNGKVNWTYKAIESVRSGAVVVGDVVVAVDNSGKIYRLGKQDGKLQGDTPNDLKEGVYATPILFSGGGGVTPTPSPGASGSASASVTASPSPSPTPGATPTTSAGGPSGNTILIATQSGHLWTYDVTAGRSTEVVN